MVSKPHYDHGLLWRAIVISLLAHAVLLLQPGFPTVSSRVGAAQSLIALLKPRAEAVSADAPITAPKAKSQPPRRVSPRLSEASVANAVTAPAPASQPVGRSADSAQTSIAPDTNKALAGMTTALGINEYDFAESKKSYLFAIAAEARRVKKYPPRAFAAGWTGTAEIRIAVAAGGNVQPLQLLKSSGHAEIDNAALSFVGTALKRTPVPENLRAQAFDFVLPVSFTINDE